MTKYVPDALWDEIERRAQRVIEAVEAAGPAQLPRNADTAAAMLVAAMILLKRAGHGRDEIITVVRNLYPRLMFVDREGPTS